MATPVHELAGGEEVLGLDGVSGILRPLMSGCSRRSVPSSERTDDRLLIGPAPAVAVSEQGVEVVGNVLIVDWQGVAVLPQGGGRLGVAKALLGLQELAVGDQDGRDGVAKAVQAHVVEAVAADERGEPVAQGAAEQSLLMFGSGGEHPRSELLAICQTLLPSVKAVVPQRDGVRAEGDAAAAAGLGGGDDLGGHAALDVQDAAVQVACLQCVELAAAGTGVSGQAQQQLDLLGGVQ